MFLNTIESHAFMNEIWEHRTQTYWTVSMLTCAIRKSLEKYTFNDAILNLDIWEDSKEHITVVKITVDGNKILIIKMLNSAFDIKMILEDILKDEFSKLCPKIIIDIV